MGRQLAQHALDELRVVDERAHLVVPLVEAAQRLAVGVHFQAAHRGPGPHRRWVGRRALELGGARAEVADVRAQLGRRQRAAMQPCLRVRERGGECVHTAARLAAAHLYRRAVVLGVQPALVLLGVLRARSIARMPHGSRAARGTSHGEVVVGVAFSCAPVSV